MLLNQMKKEIYNLKKSLLTIEKEREQSSNQLLNEAKLELVKLFDSGQIKRRI